jgi:hypothetical protein
MSRLIRLIPVTPPATVALTLTMSAISIALRPGGNYLGLVFLVSHYRFGSGCHRTSLFMFGSCVPVVACLSLN